MREKSLLVLGAGTGNLETSAKIEKAETRRCNSLPTVTRGIPSKVNKKYRRDSPLECARN